MTARDKTNTGAQKTKKTDNEQTEDNKNTASSDEDDIEVPRSQSEPPMKWIEPRMQQDPEDDELLDDPSSGEGAWELTSKRDFNTEIQTYLENKQLRAQQKAKKRLK